MGVLDDPLSDSRLMFSIYMFKEALEKANILALPTPKSVSFKRKN